MRRLLSWLSKAPDPIRLARKLVVLVIGGTVLLLGVVMIFTPGPGTVAIVAGLAILATEFVWAATLLKRVKDKAGEVTRTIRKKSGM